jgi:hypothetical protein
MTNPLVRTTTYFDPRLLNLAKKQAIDEGKSLYEIINHALQKLLEQKTTVVQKTILAFDYKQIFPTYKLGLRKRAVKRSDAYEV